MIDISMRFWGINPANSVFIPQSLALRSIVFWSIFRLWNEGLNGVNDQPKINRQKRNIFAFNRQMRKPIFAVKYPRYP